MDETEEEVLMVVDLQGIIESDWEGDIGSKCKIIGIDTDEPILQLQHYIFRGKYQDIAGTAVLFEDVSCDHDENGDRSDGHQAEQKFKYRFCTHKKLLMQRTFLKEKEEKTEVVEDQSSEQESHAAGTKSVSSEVNVTKSSSDVFDSEQSSASVSVETS